MRNPWSPEMRVFSEDFPVHIPVGSAPDKEWPYSEVPETWASQWKEDIKLHPEIPFDDIAMAEWFGMAIEVGRQIASRRWERDYYELHAKYSSLKKPSSILRRIFGRK